MKRRLFAVIAAAVVALFLSPGAGWAGEPVTITATTPGNHKVVLSGDTALFAYTHSATGDPVLVTYHAWLRPDASPGTGPVKIAADFTVTADSPSPATAVLVLPVSEEVDGVCWAYVQVDVRWPGGFATTRGPIPGKTCATPSPSPTPSESTPTPTPSHSTMTPTPSTHAPTPTPTPSATGFRLAKTGSDGSYWIAALGVLLLAIGTAALMLGRPRHFRSTDLPRRH